MKAFNFYIYGNFNNPILLIIQETEIGSWGYSSLISMAQNDYYLVIIDFTILFTSIDQITHQLPNPINTSLTVKLK